MRKFVGSCQYFLPTHGPFYVLNEMSESGCLVRRLQILLLRRTYARAAPCAAAFAARHRQVVSIYGPSWPQEAIYQNAQPASWIVKSQKCAMLKSVNCASNYRYHKLSEARSHLAVDVEINTS